VNLGYTLAVIGFGYCPAFTAYPGSQRLSADTFIALVTELALWPGVNLASST